MTAPLIIRNPVATLTKLVDGVETGAAVDVSDDVAKVELTPSIPTTNVQTFSGKYQQAADPEWTSSVSIVHNEDLEANWTPLVGFPVRVKLFDRGDLTTYRTFDTEILFNPAIAGPTAPGQARTFDMTLPVESQPDIVTPP